MRCAVIGSGLSAKDFDFNSISKGFFTIGVNAGIRLCSCDAMVFIDAVAADIYKDDIEKFEGQIFCSTRATVRIHELDMPINFKSFDLQYNDIARTWEEPFMGMMSGLSALNLATLMEPKEIYLIGYDLYPGHMFEHEWAKGKGHSDSTYAHEWTMNKIANKFDYFKNVKTPIYNCNPLSRIKTFPFKLP